jgi:hypothetical protein
MENQEKPMAATPKPSVLNGLLEQHKGFIFFIVLPMIVVAGILYFVLHKPKDKSAGQINAAIPKAASGDSLSPNDKAKAYALQDSVQEDKRRRQQQNSATPVNFNLLPPGAREKEPVYVNNGQLSPELVAQLQREKQERGGKSSEWQQLSRTSAADSMLNDPNEIKPVAKSTAPRSTYSVSNNTSDFNTITFGADGRPIQKSTQALSNSTNNRVKASRYNVRASVFQNYTVQDGSVIAFRIQQPITVEGLFVPANTKLSGQISLAHNRLRVNIPSVNINGDVEAISFEVFDQDGIQGMKIPMGLEDKVNRNEALNGQMDNLIGQGQVAANTATEASGSTQLMAASAASGLSAGIIKAFKNNKGKVIKVDIPEGYKVVLKPVKNTNGSSF